jgi:hypothetical protein
MNINPLFNDFLRAIRLTKDQRDDLITGHTTLRDRLLADKDLAKIIISTFLQGSYRRATAVRPKGDKRADVDVIVVTNIDRQKVTPHQVIDLFLPFLDKYYKGKYRVQGRSIGIELSYVNLDIVITSAPSEVDNEIYRSASVTTEHMLEDFTAKHPWKLTKAWVDIDLAKGEDDILSESAKRAEEWKLQPLWIPDRDAKCWVETHPLEQIRWTWTKNAATNYHYVNVVKAIKWFRLECLSKLEHPKGYPLEHMIGNCCPDGIGSIAEGVVKTLEKIVTDYRSYRVMKVTPGLPDRGVPSHNVWKRISNDDFVAFYDQIESYAKIARLAYDSTDGKVQVENWKKLFGSKFPDAPDDDDKGNGKGRASNNPSGGGYTERSAPSVIGGGRFS